MNLLQIITFIFLSAAFFGGVIVLSAKVIAAAVTRWELRRRKRERIKSGK